MADKIESARNYSDQSTDNGSQFEFTYDRCGNGYKTPFQAWTIYLYRGRQNFGGGFWQSLWGNGDNDGGVHVGANTPNAIAVAGTTVWVAGTCATAASDTDQIMLGWAY